MKGNKLTIIIVLAIAAGVIILNQMDYIRFNHRGKLIYRTNETERAMRKTGNDVKKGVNSIFKK
jgi:hypothetical protein